MKEDKRVDHILDQITQYIKSDFDIRTPVSEKGDDIDAIIAALNTLGEELQGKKERVYDVKRMANLLDILIEYTIMDFSRRMEISEQGDELDAVAAGLNALGEELQGYIEKLARSNEELELLNNELDSFSYSVSHDLRAPLRSIHGYAKILEEDYFDKLDEEGKNSIKVILKNVRKMGELIDDLLTFSRLGKKDINSREVEMNALVQNLVDSILSSEPDNKIKIKIKALPSVECDPVLIKQVWLNLILNAIKFSRDKPETLIEIGASKEKERILFYVKDNGVGFDMQYYNKLFGVFQRLHSQEEFEGTGVGLAIVQRIINRHHGDVWAEARLNEGAQFFFSLPKK